MSTTHFSGEAKLHYGSADFTFMETGAYVLCAVSGERISIDRLKYWSSELQEAYRDAETSTQRWKQVNP